MVKLQTQLHDFSAVRSNNESEELDFAQEMDDIKERISTLEQKRDVFPGEQSVLQQEIDSRNERLGMRRARTFPFQIMRIGRNHYSNAI